MGIIIEHQNSSLERVLKDLLLETNKPDIFHRLRKEGARDAHALNLGRNGPGV